MTEAPNPESPPGGDSAAGEQGGELLARVADAMARLSDEVARLSDRVEALAMEVTKTESSEQPGRKLSAQELAAVKSSKARAKRAARLKSDRSATPPGHD